MTDHLRIEPDGQPMPEPEWPQSSPPSVGYGVPWAPAPTVQPGWVLAVVALLCCIPLGVWALVLASKVRSSNAVGDYGAALQASRRGRVVGIVAIVLGVLVLFMRAAAGAGS